MVNSPLLAASVHVRLSHGHGGSCERSHCSTSRLPCMAASAHVCSLHGHGGSCARSHPRRGVCRCVNRAGVANRHSHGSSRSSTLSRSSASMLSSV
eukprot:scaffold34582_cov28-Tisochrysis_lutea.AAC.2